ncbi:hypothetical protein AMTR_s00010p00262460 [Amborella trichopoda]|uniref:Pentacotripeptide-repeat region of PRORP domain-containing protein n=1 Tax=Amborella trichopoda TaxID=13333 RepID=W1NF98_AMBTC|nr:hypothetical protein AMTR_s00010p00262460 [Amborella trichopoda]
MAAIRFLKTSTHKAKHQIHLSSSSALSAKTHENLSIKTQQKPSISFAPIIPHFQEEIDTENEGKSVMRAQQKMANRNQEETLISLLKLCSTMDQLRQIHAQALCTSLIHHPSILRHLLSFVALSSPSNMNYTRLVFAGIRKPEVYLYNTMLRGYSLSESPEKALFFYKQMRKIGVNTDAFASSFTLKSCANLLAVFEGKQIHCRIIQDGYEPDRCDEAFREDGN